MWRALRRRASKDLPRTVARAKLAAVSHRPIPHGALWALACLALAGCSDSETAIPHASGVRATTSGGVVEATASVSTSGNPTGETSTTGKGGSAASSTATTGTLTGSTATSSGGAATISTTSTTGVGKSTVLEQLKEYLAIGWDARPPVEDQPFASVPLDAADAATARVLIWEDYAANIREERQAETDAKAITLGEHTLRYDYTTFGDEPATGHSLFISLHGGGEADPSVNDEQWENQKILYQPDEGIYLAPRAPTNTWNLWHEPHIDPLFDRLITNLIVLAGVDPNRVYVMGYSAGGDGVYQLGPRMADHWAAAAMMAGHPNDAHPDSLRNLGFTIHVGGLDTAYDRNLVAEQWGTLLDDLQTDDPDGYPHYVEIHPDKPHWMDLEDAVALPWMAEFTRNPLPHRIVWLQDDVTHRRSYWLAVDAEHATAGSLIEAKLTGQSIDLESNRATSVLVRLSDELLDLDQAISISADGTSLYEGKANRTVAVLYTTTWERGDPALVFSAEVAVDVP